MPKLKLAPGKKIIKWLEVKGFRILRQKGSHVSLGKGELRTTVPMHAEDVPRGTIRKILKDTDLSPEVYNQEI